MVKESENGKREANEKKVVIAERHSEERQQRSQDDLSQLGSNSLSYSSDGDEGSDLNQCFHAASSHQTVSSNQRRLDSAATSVARDAVAKGAVIAIVENASKEAAAVADDDDLSRANGREANGRKKKKKKNRKDNDSNDDVDNSKDDGWRKVETKFADEKSISSLTEDSVFGRTAKPKRGDDYNGQQNTNKAADDGEANNDMESKSSNYVCTPYTPSGSSSVAGKSEKGSKNGDEKENGKKTDDNSKEKKPETSENNQENEVKRKKKVEPQKLPPTSQLTNQPVSRPPSQPDSRPTSRPACRPARKSASRPTSPPKSKNVSIAGRNSAPPDSPSTWSSARTSGFGSQSGYTSTAGSNCTQYSKSKPEAEPEVTQPMPLPTQSPRTSKNVGIAGDTARYASDAPTPSQGSKGGSICTRFSVQSKPEPSTEANQAAFDDASKVTKASEGCDKEKCSDYTNPKPSLKPTEANQAAADDASKVTKASEGCDKERCSVYTTPKPSLQPTSVPPPIRVSQLLNDDKITAVEGGGICTDFSEKPSLSPTLLPKKVQTTDEGDDDTVCYVKSIGSFQVDADDEEEGSSTTTLLLSGLGLIGLLALLSRFWGGGGKAPCIAGRHGLPLKVINISSECQMPVKLTATNCHLGLLNINAAKPDCSR